MCAASAFLALAGVTLAASLPHKTFYYEMSSSVRRVDDGCRVCYGDDCLQLDAGRCEYYLEIDEINEKPEQGGDGSPVDEMLSELTEQATMSWLAQECIPLISQYTTCNKENFCTGCEACHCSAAGRWSCSQVQRCRADHKLEMDHRTLVLVMETLLEYEKKVRRKRFVENITDKPEAKPVSLTDIAEWMYGVAPNINVDLKPEAKEVATELTANETTAQSTTYNTPTESEYLGFEEVLRNIANDQIIKRRKSQLYEDSEIALDYIDLEDTKTTGNNTSEHFMKMLNAMEEGNNVIESTSDGKFVVDLYPRDNKNIYDDYNATDYGDIFFRKEENNTIDTSSEKIESDSVNIMKRDVSSVTAINNITQETTITTTLKTTTEREKDLKNHVLIPLTNIINDKQNELKELLRIRKNLVKIMEAIHDKAKVNITKDPGNINNSDTNFSVYKLNLYSEIHEDLRRINPNVMNKLLYKLKRDIYEVFRDIARIQKLSQTEGLPDDLRLLIRSMKYYLGKQGSIRDFKKNEIQLQKINDTRKLWARKSSSTPKSIIRQLVDILEVIDKDAPQCSDFLSSSKSSKQVIKRVIKENYVNQYSVLGFKTYDSAYNLTDDLRTIGKSWPQLTAKFANSPLHEKLYALKLLHFTLAEDINKITDAMALVDFAHSRRMSPLETPLSEDVMEKINTGLVSIKQKIQDLIKYKIKNKIKHEQQQANTKQKKKESFLKRIRSMIRSSKNDIIDMVRKKMPKTEIFRTVAQRKLNELSQKRVPDDEQTMLRWQNVLSLTRRKKRDVAAHIKTIKNRIKNIIPKYLRGKINPAIAKHKFKKQSGTKKKTTLKHYKISSTVKPTKRASSKATSPLNYDTSTVKAIS